MNYYKVYTKDKVPLLYAKTEQNVTPEELCGELGCSDCIAIPITRQCFEELMYSKYNNWDLKEI